MFAFDTFDIDKVNFILNKHYSNNDNNQEMMMMRNNGNFNDATKFNCMLESANLVSILYSKLEAEDWKSLEAMCLKKFPNLYHSANNWLEAFQKKFRNEKNY